MFLILSLLACAEKGPAVAELEATLTAEPDAEPLAWNDQVRVIIEATGPEDAPALSLAFEDPSGAQLPVEEAVDTSRWDLVAITSDTGFMDSFGATVSFDIRLPEGITPGYWDLVLLGEDGELDRVESLEVAGWGYVEEDPEPLLPLGEPMRGTLYFTQPEGVSSVLDSFIEADPVLELVTDEAGELGWRVMMWNADWLNEGDVAACRLLEGEASLDADGRFVGDEPEVLNTMDSGEQFYLYDQHIEGGVDADGQLGGVRLSGAVDMSLFNTWTEGEACALIAGFGIACTPCAADPSLECLDAAVAIRDLQPLNEPIVYEDLPWCSAASDDIPSLDFDIDLDFDCSGCASSGRGGVEWLVLGLALVALRRRRR